MTNGICYHSVSLLSMACVQYKNVILQTFYVDIQQHIYKVGGRLLSYYLYYTVACSTY